MNMDEESLQLFEYVPNAYPSLYIPNTEPPDLITLQNIDDNLLNGLEPPGWTLGNIPVVLNTSFLTADQPTIVINSSPHTNPNLETQNILLKNEPAVKSILKTKRVRDKQFIQKQPVRIITEDGLFMSENVNASSNVEQASEMQAKCLESILKPKNTASEGYIDINNLILQNNNKVVQINNKPLVVNVSKSIAKRKKRIILPKNLTPKNVSRTKNVLEICNNNITKLVNVDSILNDSSLLSSNYNEHVQNEPDSNINNTETMNIVDMADVITAYQCKQCDFWCNDQDEFLQHYKAQHTQIVVLKEDINNDETENFIIPDTIIDFMPPCETTSECMEPNLNLQKGNTYLLYTSNIDVSTDDIHKRKIMRVKRKQIKKKSKYNLDIMREEIPTISPIELFEKSVGSIPTDCNDKTDDETDDGINIYLCSQCGSQFGSVGSCRNHMIDVHKFQSVDERKDVGNEVEKNIEKVEVTEEMKCRNTIAINKFLTTDLIKSRKNKCTIKGCQYRFAKPELLERHEKCHVDDKKNLFKCPECENHFDSWRVCSLHLWNCHQMDLDMYPCPLCNYRGSTPMKLRNHLKIHTNDKEYKCPDCSKSFNQASQMRNHRVIHLDKQLHDIPKWYSQKHCERCDKNFADSKCLKKHIQAVHSKLKPFICNVCGHSCARKAMLQTHLRQHTGEKPYACKICYYKTGDHNSLRRHVMRHSGVRPYKCPHCSYKAIQSNSYKNHLANKHPGKGGAYYCTYCNFTCVNEEVFETHVKEHKKGLIDNNVKREDKEDTIVNNINGLFNYNDASSNTINKKVCDLENTQTITQGENVETEDDETQHCFLSLRYINDEQTVDTGGITIPADP